jgi:hypothetical protein
MEQAAPAYPSIASLEDERETVLLAAPAPKPDGSLSILAAGALIHAGINDGRLYIAHLDRSDGRMPLKLVVIPYRDPPEPTVSAWSMLNPANPLTGVPWSGAGLKPGCGW